MGKRGEVNGQSLCTEGMLTLTVNIQENITHYQLQLSRIIKEMKGINYMWESNYKDKTYKYSLTWGEGAVTTGTRDVKFIQGRAESKHEGKLDNNILLTSNLIKQMTT